MKKEFTCAVIGLGAIHMNHVNAIRSCENARLISVCDIKEELAKKKAAEMGCSGYTDFCEMIEKEHPDVVHLCTPHDLHKPMAVFAMRHGCHVLTEKPMAISEAEADEMIRVSKETGMRLGVCFQNRYNPTSVRIREVLDSGELGDFVTGRMTVAWDRDIAYYHQAEWRGKWATEGGGVLMNQAIHTLDLLEWYTGEPDAVSAQITNFRLRGQIEVEDTAHGYLSYPSGRHALFYATVGYGCNAPVEIELVMEGGTIFLKKDLTIVHADGSKEVMGDQSLVSGKKGYWGNGHERLIHDFYQKLMTGEHFPIDGVEGAKVLRLIMAIYRSSGLGGEPVPIR